MRSRTVSTLALPFLLKSLMPSSQITTVIWLEGINDFSKNGNASVETVRDRMKEIVTRMRAKIPGVQVIGATLTSALNATNANHGSAEQDAKRKALNEFIRTSGVF